MFFLQGLIGTLIDMAYKIIETLCSFIKDFSKPHHIKPGYTFITEFVPAFFPNCLAEGSLGVRTKRRCCKLSPVPDSFECIIRCLIRPAFFILSFSIYQKHFGIADHWHIQVISLCTFYTGAPKCN